MCGSARTVDATYVNPFRSGQWIKDNQGDIAVLFETNDRATGAAKGMIVGREGWIGGSFPYTYDSSELDQSKPLSADEAIEALRPKAKPVREFQAGDRVTDYDDEAGVVLVRSATTGEVVVELEETESSTGRTVSAGVYVYDAEDLTLVDEIPF